MAERGGKEDAVIPMEGLPPVDTPPALAEAVESDYTLLYRLHVRSQAISALSR